MHVVGARFEHLESAAMALAQIRASVPVPHADVAVRPLGSTRYEEPARDFLLAGRFAASDVERVIEILRTHGGTVLSNRVEWAPAQLASRSAATTGQWTPREHRPWPGDRHAGQPARDRQAPRAAQPRNAGAPSTEQLTPAPEPGRVAQPCHGARSPRAAQRIHPTPPAPAPTAASRRRLRRPNALLRVRAAKIKRLSR
jgi:hypothetical protein